MQLRRDFGSIFFFILKIWLKLYEGTLWAFSIFTGRTEDLVQTLLFSHHWMDYDKREELAASWFFTKISHGKIHKHICTFSEIFLIVKKYFNICLFFLRLICVWWIYWGFYIIIGFWRALYKHALFVMPILWLKSRHTESSQGYMWRAQKIALKNSSFPCTQ